MTSQPTHLRDQTHRDTRRVVWHRSITACLVAVCLALAEACSEPPLRPPLPPSASDLVLLKTGRLCDTAATFALRAPHAGGQVVGWGGGKEHRFSSEASDSKAEESWYFDQEGFLVGAVFTYPAGLLLEPYPVLRETLSQLRSVKDFYVNVARLPTKSQLNITRLYQTGDEKTTTQYLVTGTPDNPILLMASFAIDPYVQLFTPTRKEFLDRLRGPESEKSSQGTVDQVPYAALQEFARGEAALLAYCGVRAPAVAVDAYEKSIASGISGKVRLAEARHKLGLAWEATGDLEKAKTEMELSLAIRPNTPEVMNNLGTTYLQLGDRDRAIALFEKAVSIRPNYPLARYNLAEALELTNRKVAISEYETYLALVEGLPEEAPRAALVKKKLKDFGR